MHVVMDNHRYRVGLCQGSCSMPHLLVKCKTCKGHVYVVIRHFDNLCTCAIQFAVCDLNCPKFFWPKLVEQEVT